MKAVIPSAERKLFQYTDYRLFLKDYYQTRKRSQSGWGLESWAHRLGLKSKSTLAMILNGQRNPGRSLVNSLVTYFQFASDEAEYFSDLVEWCKNHGSGNLSSLLLERLAKKRKSGTFELIDLDTFSLISRWYYPALQELFQVRGFRLDEQWISHQLNGQLTAREVREALKTLTRIGILKRKTNRQYELVSVNTTTNSDIAHEGIKQFHEQILSKASESLRRVPVGEREIAGSTFAVRQEDLPKAKRMIREMMSQFADAIEASPGDRVYQLEVCFFPLTRMRSQS